MEQIAHIESRYKEKFGVPRQAGLVDCEARVVFEPQYRFPESVRGLEEFDYIWLIWQFHLNKVDKFNVDTLNVDKFNVDKLISSRDNVSTTQQINVSTDQQINHSTHWSPTVRPPRLGGNKRVGVFATRSPFRPNPIGLSSVRLLRIEAGPVLVVAAADLVDGTPILDIKPYIAYADAHPQARSGFAPQAPQPLRGIVDDHGLLRQLPVSHREAIEASLLQDPRPHYQNDSNRLYVMQFDRWKVSFRVSDHWVEVVELKVKSS